MPIDPVRVGRDAGRVAEEIVQHLVGLPATEVEIHLEIQAHIPEGASENVVRRVTENRRTLKFKTHGFAGHRGPPWGYRTVISYGN